MPRDSASIFTLVPGYQAVTGQTIQASQHNPPLEDIAQALTGSLARNGTGAMLADLNMGGFRVTGAGAATSANDLITKSAVEALIAAAVAPLQAIPAGTVAYFAAAAPIPTGWLAANGATVSRTTYAALFAIIGITYGAGDSSTTFGLPDLRGEFIRGWDNARGIDVGRALGSAQGEAFLAHNHLVNDPGHTHATTALTFTGASVAIGSGGTGIASAAAGENITSATGISIAANGGTETRPRNVALQAIIKY